MACILETCENGWEIRHKPDTNEPIAFGCKQCKPHLRFMQINGEYETHDDWLNALDKRKRRISEGDRNAI